MPAWNLETALPIIRAIEPIAKRCNFSVALRGSVLTQGESDKDLDLCFLCERGKKDRKLCSIDQLLQEIQKEMPAQVDRYGGIVDLTHPTVPIWLRDGRHIDAHFWI